MRALSRFDAQWKPIAFVAASAPLLLLAACGGGKPADVTVHVAGGATIHDNPGGVGQATAVQDIPVLLDPTVYRGRIQVTSVSVLPGAHVTKGQPLLGLDPVALKVNAVVVQQQLAAAQGQIAAAQQAQQRGQAQGASLGAISQQITALQNAVQHDDQVIANVQSQIGALPTPAPVGPPTAADIQSQHQALNNQLTTAQQQSFRDQAALASARASYQSTSANVYAATQGGDASVVALSAQVSLDQQLLDIAKGAAPSITSPIDGDVASVSISAGQAATPGVPLVEIIDPSKLRVNARIPISELPYVNVGAAAHLTFGAIPGSGLDGTVVAVFPTTSDGLTMQVTVDANNPTTAVPRVVPGLIASVSIEATRPVSVAVPRICVLNIDQDPQAFVVDASNVAHRRTLRIGAADTDHVEVLTGIAAGERCVVAGNQSLSDGAAVHITTVET